MPKGTDKRRENDIHKLYKKGNSKNKTRENIGMMALRAIVLDLYTEALD